MKKIPYKQLIKIESKSWLLQKPKPKWAKDIEEGKVSNESPLGMALIGKDKGDKVSFMTPKGEAIYTIQEVN